MSFIEIRTESAFHAYQRVSNNLREVESVALGPNSTKKDIDDYNNLHAQVKRKHPGGTVGHLHLRREIVVFNTLTIPAPDKKVPFKVV